MKISEHEVIGDEIDKHKGVGTVDMQEIDKKHTVKKHVKSEEEYRCRDDDVCLRSGSGDEGDDDAYLPLRTVFPISFDCLDSHSVGMEGKMHIESQVGPEAAVLQSMVQTCRQACRRRVQ